MARILLDTHAFLWWCEDSPKLSPKAVSSIKHRDNLVFVSAACLWELATKIRIGKLVFPRIQGGSLLDEINAEDFTALPITAEHAELAGSLAHDHRDPFDRMIIAQALAEDLILISNETLFDDFGVRRLW